jgi:hypothetical protein
LATIKKQKAPAKTGAVYVYMRDCWLNITVSAAYCISLK